VVVLALAAVAVHVLDDNYVEPAPGTSAADHLASGLIPLAVLIIATALYVRFRAGFDEHDALAEESPSQLSLSAWTSAEALDVITPLRRCPVT
jgi:hypothetical protein